MGKEQHGDDTNKFKMKPKPGSPPGIEVDEHGKAIPLDQRTAENRQAATAASAVDQTKDPEGDAEAPASMVRGGKKS